MKHIRLPDMHTRPLEFYLALEEWVAETLPPADYFMTWRVSPTVIIGRHQELEVEVDTAYCRAHGIAMVRRKSGGGAVMADMGNLMFSLVTPATDVVATFSRYTTMVSGFLRSLGLEAEATGRNDVVVDGRKISGNAYYYRRGRSIVHGTLLHSYDMERMNSALTPSRAKLASKGVTSVSSRVCGVSEFLDISMEELRRRAVEQITDSAVELSDADICDVERMAESYRAPGWLEAGRTGRAATTRRVRIDGVGEMSLRYVVRRGVMDEVTLQGDYFERRPIGEALSALLCGCKPQRQAVGEALEHFDPSLYVENLSVKHILNLIET